MINYVLILIIILLLFCSAKEKFSGLINLGPDPECNSKQNIFFKYPPNYRGPLQRNMLDFPSYPLPMPDKYSFGRMFLSDAPEISYKPGFW